MVNVIAVLILKRPEKSMVYTVKKIYKPCSIIICILCFTQAVAY